MWVCKANKKYTLLTDICLSFFIIFIGALCTISLWRRDLCLVARWWHHCCSLHPLTQPPSQFRHDHPTEPAAPARQDHGQDLPITTHSPAPRSAGGRRSSRSNNSNGWDPAWSRRRWAVRREPLQLLSTFHCSLCYVLWELDGGKREKDTRLFGSSQFVVLFVFSRLVLFAKRLPFFGQFCTVLGGRHKTQHQYDNQQAGNPTQPSQRPTKQADSGPGKESMFIYSRFMISPCTPQKKLCG